jgi:hypothetical protein
MLLQFIPAENQKFLGSEFAQHDFDKLLPKRARSTRDQNHLL